MPNAHPLNTPLPQLLQAGGASQQAINYLTPTARQATRGTLLHLWLRGEAQAHGQFGQEADNMPDSSHLTQPGHQRHAGRVRERVLLVGRGRRGDAA